MSVMSIRRKAILVNGVLLFTLLGLLFFYPAYAVAVSAAVLFSAANMALLFDARRKRRKPKPRAGD